jgi:hypothetical protein
MNIGWLCNLQGEKLHGEIITFSNREPLAPGIFLPGVYKTIEIRYF